MFSASVSEGQRPRRDHHDAFGDMGEFFAVHGDVRVVADGFCYKRPEGVAVHGQRAPGGDPGPVRGGS